MNNNNNYHQFLDEKKELLKLLRQKQKIEEDKNLLYFVPTMIQEAFLLSRAKIRVVEGANRPGKTYVCGVDTDIQVTGIVPHSLKDLYPKEYLRKGCYWVSSLDFASSRDVARPMIEKFLPKRFIKGFNKADYIYYLTENSQIGFKSQDSGREKYQGTSRLSIWLDEEHAKDVYDECYMRTIDCGGRITLSFTPVAGLTWAYDKLFKKAKKFYSTINTKGIKEEVGVIHTPEELALITNQKNRKLIIQENTDGSADKNIEVFQMKMYDNPYLPHSEIQNAEKECKDDIALYQARILGVFAKITGRQVYSVPMLLKGKTMCSTIFKRGTIEKNQFQPKLDGKLITFKDKKKDGAYIIAADIAEGIEGGDFTCFQVLDHNTCEQIAVWHGHLSPDRASILLMELGKYYNYAWLAPERNFHGFGVVNSIRDQKYPRLYCDYDIPHTVITESGAIGVKKYGWDTNVKTKPIMVQDMGKFLSEGHIKINDPNTWDELLTFVYDKHGKMGALKGCWDDRAVALMIALQVFIRRRPVRTSLKQYEKPKPDKYTGY